MGVDLGGVSFAGAAVVSEVDILLEMAMEISSPARSENFVVNVKGIFSVDGCDFFVVGLPLGIPFMVRTGGGVLILGLVFLLLVVLEILAMITVVKGSN